MRANADTKHQPTDDHLINFYRDITKSRRRRRAVTVKEAAREKDIHLEAIHDARIRLRLLDSRNTALEANSLRPRAETGELTQLFTEDWCPWRPPGLEGAPLTTEETRLCRRRLKKIETRWLLGLEHNNGHVDEAAIVDWVRRWEVTTNRRVERKWCPEEKRAKGWAPDPRLQTRLEPEDQESKPGADKPPALGEADEAVKIWEDLQACQETTGTEARDALESYMSFQAKKAENGIKPQGLREAEEAAKAAREAAEEAREAARKATEEAVSKGASRAAEAREARRVAGESFRLARKAGEVEAIIQREADKVLAKGRWRDELTEQFLRKRAHKEVAEGYKIRKANERKGLKPRALETAPQAPII